jgi:hypothetical protein
MSHHTFLEYTRIRLSGRVIYRDEGPSRLVVLVRPRVGGSKRQGHAGGGPNPAFIYNFFMI